MNTNQIFKEHQNTIWGTICSCGNYLSILQNSHHPWDNEDFTIKMSCSNCFQQVEITTEIAKNFYNQKIYSYFNNIQGHVLDLGCGGGFLSEYLLKTPLINKVTAIDIYELDIKKLKDTKFTFVRNDISQLDSLFPKKSFDFLVSRDVFMYIEDTDKYFDDVTNLTTTGIYQMGWYISNHPRIKNSLSPIEIVDEYKERGWKVEVEFLDWYKSGYFIKALK